MLITEKYQFTWPGKSDSIELTKSPSNVELELILNKSVGFNGESGSDTSNNLYIEGDNLYALKALLPEYYAKIKLIYIDPPYNTGNNFLYVDDFSSKSISTKDGGRHTDWLNMIYPRLLLARELLREDGSIFVSIDFHEVHNLRKVMDEIFGENNFQREIIWRIGWLSGYKTTASNFIRNHDTILFYSKNHKKMYFNKVYIDNSEFKPVIKRTPSLTSKLFSLGLDRLKQKELLHFINHINRPTKYPIEDVWNGNEYDELNSINIMSFSGEKVSKVLGLNHDFKGQKSIKMIQRIIEAITTEDDIVLDFFAGTGSTGCAVLQQNILDNSNRRFILVQLPVKYESTEDSPYDTLCDISEDRIKHFAESITNKSIDSGFKVYKVVEREENAV